VTGPGPLGALLGRCDVVICVGTGGVGKTSTAAALGVAAAEAGRRVVVVTIDPARRLADAIGTGRLSNSPSPIPGPWPGTLDAVALDATAAFDDLVRRRARDAAQAERILTNRFYRAIASGIGGTQEYMAVELLAELHSSGRWDLVVVDTPPSANALDAFDAPDRLRRFLDHRVYRALTASGSGIGRVVGRTAHGVVRAAGRVAGGEVVDDAIAFFTAFDGMEDEFRRRAREVTELLRAQTTGFVLVTAPRADTVAEARRVVDALAGRRLRIDVIAANRMTPRFTGRAAGSLEGDDPGLRTLARLTARREAEEALLVGLAERAVDTPVVALPLLDRDVTDVDTLAELGRLAVAAPSIADGHAGPVA